MLPHTAVAGFPGYETSRPPFTFPGSASAEMQYQQHASAALLFQEQLLLLRKATATSTEPPPQPSTGRARQSDLATQPTLPPVGLFPVPSFSFPDEGSAEDTEWAAHGLVPETQKSTSKTGGETQPRAPFKRPRDEAPTSPPSTSAVGRVPPAAPSLELQTPPYGSGPAPESLAAALACNFGDAGSSSAEVAAAVAVAAAAVPATAAVAAAARPPPPAELDLSAQVLSMPAATALASASSLVAWAAANNAAITATGAAVLHFPAAAAPCADDAALCGLIAELLERDRRLNVYRYKFTEVPLAVDDRTYLARYLAGETSRRAARYLAKAHEPSAPVFAALATAGGMGEPDDEAFWEGVHELATSSGTGNVIEYLADVDDSALTRLAAMPESCGKRRPSAEAAAEARSPATASLAAAAAAAAAVALRVSSDASVRRPSRAEPAPPPRSPPPTPLATPVGPNALASLPPFGWNISTLDARNDLLRAIMPGQDFFHNSEIAGVTTPHCYVGSAGTGFMMHAEDQNLASANYLITGHAKVWYVVPPEFYNATVRALRDEFRGSGAGAAVERCPHAAMHKRYLVHPEVLRTVHGIPVSRVVQRPGDLVITAPGTFHFGFNAGPNLAEATNLAWRDWLGADGLFRAALQAGRCTCSHARFAFDEASLRESVRVVGSRFGVAATDAVADSASNTT